MNDALDRGEYHAEMAHQEDHAQPVPCRWCGELTDMTGTKMCDRHYELSTRIEREPEMAARMLAEVRK